VIRVASVASGGLLVVLAIVALAGCGGHARGCALGPVRPVAQVPAQRTWLLGVDRDDRGSHLYAETRHGVFASDDQGDTWRRIGPGHRLLALDLNDPRHQVATARGAILVSWDAGRSWRRADAPACASISAVALPAGDSQVVYGWGSDPLLPGDRSKGGIYRSSNGAHSFTRIAGYDPTDLNGAVVGADAQTVYVGAQDGVYVSTSGGKRWKTTKLQGDIGGVFDAQTLPRVAFAAAGTGRSVSAADGEGGETQRLWRTDDAGATWRPTLELFDIESVLTAPHDVATVYVQGERIAHRQSTELLLKSTDSGQHWTTMQRRRETSAATAGSATAPIGPKAYSLTVDPARSNVLYRDTGTALQRSNDGGRTFQALHVAASTGRRRSTYHLLKPPVAIVEQTTSGPGFQVRVRLNRTLPKDVSAAANLFVGRASADAAPVPFGNRARHCYVTANGDDGANHDPDLDAVKVGDRVRVTIKIAGQPALVRTVTLRSRRYEVSRLGCGHV
jgi:photosystem II stability/assembly factor-like uncharacterized protein